MQGASRVKGEPLRDAFSGHGGPEKAAVGGPQGIPQSSSRTRPLRRLAACRDNEASGEGVRALSADAITWLKSLHGPGPALASFGLTAWLTLG